MTQMGRILSNSMELCKRHASLMEINGNNCPRLLRFSLLKTCVIKTSVSFSGPLIQPSGLKLVLRTVNLLILRCTRTTKAQGKNQSDRHKQRVFFFATHHYRFREHGSQRCTMASRLLGMSDNITRKR